jgi:hypothetical protein
MADTQKVDGIFNLTAPVVMSFPHLFEAKAFKKNGKETGEAKFSAQFIFPADSEDLKGMKQLAAKLARAKWPDRQFSELHFPFASGDKVAEKRVAKGKHDNDHIRGKVIITAKSKYEPKLAYIDNGRIVDIETEIQKAAQKNRFYSGVEVLAQINLLPYEGGQGDGVTAYLNMVISTGKGARLSGGQTASEAFRGYVGSISAEDPTAPGADENLDDLLGM